SNNLGASCQSDCAIGRIGSSNQWLVLKEAIFDSISVRYNDISEWFLHWRRIEGSTGETLRWTNTPKSINVSVRTPDEHFDLRSRHHSSHRQSGEDLILHEHMEFVFSAKERRFSLSDIKIKTNELLFLFSILLACPVTIRSVSVSQKSGSSFRIWFLMFRRPEGIRTDGISWNKFFAQTPVSDERWQSVFDRYYQSEYKKTCWVRLAGMQRYNGVWEYQILGYVSLLERYLNIRFDGSRLPESVPPSSKKISKFRSDLANEIPDIPCGKQERIVAIARRAFASDRFSFENKYTIAMNDINPDIKKIINLTENEFSLIKKVRNRIAHGDGHDLEEEDFLATSQTQVKISLLMVYWAFLDFGFTTREFIRCLSSTHNSLGLTEMIDRVHMERITQADECSQ
ncbi:hypothetical protein LOC54_04420, partial [Acetobacter sp. AN02]|uniref:ApeA N-terminal domain 1-containing protein n=1 Tax=Acetobacter sp. AN02 TaxID=2894186 RepID=UPI0024343A9B